MKAYQIYNAHGENEETGPTRDFRVLDGRKRQVRPLGYEFDKDMDIAVHEDGGFLRPSVFVQGVRMDPTHLLTRIEVRGPKRKLTDVQSCWNTFIVNDHFRAVMERLEPGRHQFEPVDLVWKDGTSEGTGRYYWFIPIARIDGMDREKTSMTFQEDIRKWKHVPGGKYVVNWSRVGDHAIWYDQCIGNSRLWVSEVFKREMDTAGVTGLGYYEAPTV